MEERGHLAGFSFKMLELTVGLRSCQTFLWEAGKPRECPSIIFVTIVFEAFDDMSVPEQL